MRTHPARTFLAKSRSCRAGPDANPEGSHVSTINGPRSYYNRGAYVIRTGSYEPIVEVRRSGNGQDLRADPFVGRRLRADPSTSNVPDHEVRRLSFAWWRALLERRGRRADELVLVSLHRGYGRLQPARRTRSNRASGSGPRSPRGWPVGTQDPDPAGRPAGRHEDPLGRRPKLSALLSQPSFRTSAAGRLAIPGSGVARCPVTRSTQTR